MYFLTINAGSSSIKFCLFDAETLTQKYAGALSGIGFASTTFTVSGGQQLSEEVVAADHLVAWQIIRNWITQNIVAEQITAIGHRVVHGGPQFSSSCLINDEVVSALQKVVPLDPEHLPTELSLIEQVEKDFSKLPQIACFDTAFFHDLPTVSRLLPLPRRLETEGLRHYGFHGLSYSYLLEEFGRVAGQTAAKGKIIFAHLGNGASLAAIEAGKPIDTSMGLTPAGGVPMSTRSGDLDPGILTYLAAQKNLSPEQLQHMIGFESGLLGISETTADMKQLLSLEAEDPRAQDAVDIFCYHVKKYIGAYAAALGGLNSLVFSGGIGEVSAPVRARICQGLEFLGITLDDERNQTNAECISTDGTKVGVHVLPTNEAVTIARDMQRLINKTGKEQ